MPKRKFDSDSDYGSDGEKQQEDKEFDKEQGNILFYAQQNSQSINSGNIQFSFNHFFHSNIKTETINQEDQKLILSLSKLLNFTELNASTSNETPHEQIDLNMSYHLQLNESQRQLEFINESSSSQILQSINPDFTQSERQNTVQFQQTIQNLLQKADLQARNNSYQTIKLLHSALNKTKSNTIEQSEILYKKCQFYTKIQKIDSFQKCIEQALRIAIDLEDEFYIAKYKSLRVRFYVSLNIKQKYEKAFKLGQEAQKIYKDLKRQNDAALLYTSLGWLYIDYKKKYDKQKAQQYYKKAFKISEKVLNDVQNIQSKVQEYLQVVVRCGIFYQKIQEYEKAVVYFQKFKNLIQNKLKYSQIIDPNYAKITLTFFASYSYFKIHKFTEAIQNFGIGLEIIMDMLKEHQIQYEQNKKKQVIYNFVDQICIDQCVGAKDRLDETKKYQYLLEDPKFKQSKELAVKVFQMYDNFEKEVQKYLARKEEIQKELDYIWQK